MNWKGIESPKCGVIVQFGFTVEMGSEGGGGGGRSGEMYVPKLWRFGFKLRRGVGMGNGKNFKGFS